MKKMASLLPLVVIVMVIGCDLFGNDNSSSSDPNWKRISVPKILQGTWYVGDVSDMIITSKTVTMNNREWITQLSDKNKNNDQYRLIITSQREYKAMYIKIITDNSAQRIFGWGMYTSFEAQKSELIGEWVTITKK